MHNSNTRSHLKYNFEEQKQPNSIVSHSSSQSKTHRIPGFKSTNDILNFKRGLAGNRLQQVDHSSKFSKISPDSKGKQN